MNQGTKQRVIGTVVLLALALIFLPILFDGDGNYSAPIESRIPVVPMVSIMPEPIPYRPVIQSDEFETETAPDVAESTPEIATAEPEVESTDNATATIASNPPQLDEAGLPVGWSVRLGLFSNSQNAGNLTRRLTDAGYRAYTRELVSDQDVMTAVFVGPRLDKADADRLKLELQDEFELAGMVVEYEVDEI